MMTPECMVLAELGLEGRWDELAAMNVIAVTEAPGSVNHGITRAIQNQDYPALYEALRGDAARYGIL